MSLEMELRSFVGLPQAMILQVPLEACRGLPVNMLPLESRSEPVPALWRMVTYAGEGEVAQGAPSEAPLLSSFLRSLSCDIGRRRSLIMSLAMQEQPTRHSAAQ